MNGARRPIDEACEAAVLEGMVMTRRDGRSVPMSTPQSGANGRALWWVGVMCVVPALVMACSGGARTPRSLLMDTGSDRPADGLLGNPTLQRVVDLQVKRDAVGIETYLTHDDPLVRARAAFALGSVQARSAVTALVGLLADEHPRVRADAAFALGQTADTTVTTELFTAVQHEVDPTVRRRLVEAIGKTAGHGAPTSLAELPAELDITATVALALARMGTRGVNELTAVNWLTQRLIDPDLRIRRNAAYYFGRLTTTIPWAFAVRQVRGALDAYAPSDPSAMFLALALGRLRRADEHRLERVASGAMDWRVRNNATSALALLGNRPGIQDALYRALDDDEVHVAVTGARSLDFSNGGVDAEPERIEDWIERHPDRWRVIGPLLTFLGSRGDSSYVVDWVRGHQSGPRAPFVATVAALGRTPGPDAFALLKELSHHEDPSVASAALTALRSRWRQPRLATEGAGAYYELFAAGLRRGDLATATAAAPALSDSTFRGMGATQLLGDAYRAMEEPHDIEPMVEIVRALGGTGDPRAVPFLREAVTNGHPVVRQAAAAALARLTGEHVAAAGDPPAPMRQVDWEYLRAVGSRPRLTLDTRKGSIVVTLLTEEAPLTVQTVLQLAETGRYDGVPFHRVVPNFVIQGGDVQRGDGFGGPGYVIRSEFTRVPFERGVVGMASAGKDTEGSQFFITHSVQPHLDGRYTAFGWVSEGLDTLDRVYQGDEVTHATVQRSR